MTLAFTFIPLGKHSSVKTINLMLIPTITFGFFDNAPLPKGGNFNFAVSIAWLNWSGAMYFIKKK